ncbi:hypothetical protein ACT3S5_16270 [Halomonas sp. AOP31-B1-25]|uniref:hypothetical protein n=1 Tax=Halomonas sp. AOP31-B1-25 TaxID=3457694 RepID=UPI0040331A60
MFKFLKIKEAHDELVRDFREMTKKDGWSYSEWVEKIVADKEFFLRTKKMRLVNGYVSLRSHGQANFLTFVTDSDNFYTVVQRLECVWSVIDHENNVAYIEKELTGSRLRSFYDFFKFIRKNHISFSSPEFMGILFANHNRPYHQVYDCVSSFLKLEEKFSYGLVSKEYSFFSPSSLGRNSCLINSKEVKNVLGGFYVFPCIDRCISIENTVAKMLGNIQSKKNKYNIPVVWVGLGGLKRTLIGLEEFLNKFIENSLEEHGDCFFIFDGLTSPVGEDFLIASKEYNSKEKKVIARIVEKRNLHGKYIELFGAKAEEKLQWASIADFFVSNALTDSMWCSLFYRLPGVVHYSPLSLKEVLKTQKHYKSYFLPKEIIQSERKEGKPGPWSDYTIDPLLISKICSSGLSSALYLKNFNLLSEKREPLLLGEEIELSEGASLCFKKSDLVIDGLDLDMPYDQGAYEVKFDIEILSGGGCFSIANEDGLVFTEKSTSVLLFEIQDEIKSIEFSFISNVNTVLKFFGVRVQKIIDYKGVNNGFIGLHS